MGFSEGENDNKNDQNVSIIIDAVRLCLDWDQGDDDINWVPIDICACRCLFNCCGVSKYAHLKNFYEQKFLISQIELNNVWLNSRSILLSNYQENKMDKDYIELTRFRTIKSANFIETSINFVSKILEIWINKTFDEDLDSLCCFKNYNKYHMEVIDILNSKANLDDLFNTEQSLIDLFKETNLGIILTFKYNFIKNGLQLSQLRKLLNSKEQLKIILDTDEFKNNIELISLKETHKRLTSYIEESNIEGRNSAYVKATDLLLNLIDRTPCCDMGCDTGILLYLNYPEDLMSNKDKAIILDKIWTIAKKRVLKNGKVRVRRLFIKKSKNCRRLPMSCILCIIPFLLVIAWLCFTIYKLATSTLTL